MARLHKEGGQEVVDGQNALAEATRQQLLQTAAREYIEIRELAMRRPYQGTALTWYFRGLVIFCAVTIDEVPCHTIGLERLVREGADRCLSQEEGLNNEILISTGLPCLWGSVAAISSGVAKRSGVSQSGTAVPLQHTASGVSTALHALRIHSHNRECWRVLSITSDQGSVILAQGVQITKCYPLVVRGIFPGMLCSDYVPLPCYNAQAPYNCPPPPPRERR